MTVSLYVLLVFGGAVALVGVFLFRRKRELALKDTIGVIREDIERKDWGRARQRLQSALERHPKNLEFIRMRGEVAEGTRREAIERAVRAIEEVDATRDWEWAQERLVLAEQSFPDETALREIRERIESRRMERSQRKAQIEFAAVREEIGREDWERAFQRLESALQSDPTNSEAAALRRVVAEGMRRREIERFVGAVNELEAKGDWTQAEAMLASARQSFPDEPALAELRDRIARRRVQLMHYAPMVREKIAAGDFEGAERLLAETKGQLSDDATWSALSAELRERKDRRREELPQAESVFATGVCLETGDDLLEEFLKKQAASSSAEPPTTAPSAAEPPTTAPRAAPPAAPSAEPVPSPAAPHAPPPRAEASVFWGGAASGKGVEPSERSRVTDERQMLVPPEVLIDNVHFTLTAPGVLERGMASEIQFWVHVEQQRQAVLERAREAQGPEALGMIVRSDGPFVLQRGARLSVRIRVGGVEVWR